MLRWTGPAGPAARRRHRPARRPTGRGVASRPLPSSSGRSTDQRTCRPKMPAWSIVCGAPRSRSSGGRSAVRRTSGTRASDASTTAGSSSATAVPDVTTTATGRREARPSPSAKKPADRSSRRTRTRRPGMRPHRERERRRARPGADDDVGHPARPPAPGRSPAARATSVTAASSATPPSAAVIVRSFSLDSSHSRAGSESATIPQPANRTATRPRTSAQRSATISSPSPSAPSQPIGPAYQPRSKPSCSAMSASAMSRGSPPTAGVGWRRPASAEQPGLLAQRPGHRGHEVLDVAQRQDPGRVGDGQRLDDRGELGAQGVDDDGVLLAVLLAREQRGGEPRVRLGVGAARRRAGDRHGLERPPDRAREALRRRAEERGPLAREGEGRALRGGRGEVPKRGGRRRGRRAPRTPRDAPGRPCRSGRARRHPRTCPRSAPRRLGQGARRRSGGGRSGSPRAAGGRPRPRGRSRPARPRTVRGRSSRSGAIATVRVAPVPSSDTVNVGRTSDAAPNGAHGSSPAGSAPVNPSPPTSSGVDPDRVGKRRPARPWSPRRTGPVRQPSNAHARPIPTIDRPTDGCSQSAASRPWAVAAANRAIGSIGSIAARPRRAAARHPSPSPVQSARSGANVGRAARPCRRSVTVTTTAPGRSRSAPRRRRRFEEGGRAGSGRSFRAAPGRRSGASAPRPR